MFIFIAIARANFISSGAFLIIETVTFKSFFTTKVAIILIYCLMKIFDSIHDAINSIAETYYIATLTTCTI